MSSPSTIQPVSRTVKENCLPEGRRIVTFQQDISALTWSQGTYQGASVWMAHFQFDVRSANSQPLTAMQSLIVSIITGGANLVPILIDTGNNLPIYIGSTQDADTDYCFYGIIPYLSTSDLINVTLFFQSDPTGLIQGLISLGVANFEMMPIAIASLNEII